MKSYGLHLPPLFLHMVPSLKDKPPYFDLHLTEPQWLPDVDPGTNLWYSTNDFYERDNYENRYNNEAMQEELNSPISGPRIDSGPTTDSEPRSDSGFRIGSETECQSQSESESLAKSLLSSKTIYCKNQLIPESDPGFDIPSITDNTSADGGHKDKDKDRDRDGDTKKEADGDKNRDGSGDKDGNRTETGTETRTGTETETGTEVQSRDGNGNGNGNGDRNGNGSSNSNNDTNNNSDVTIEIVKARCRQLEEDNASLLKRIEQLTILISNSNERTISIPSVVCTVQSPTIPICEIGSLTVVTAAVVNDTNGKEDNDVSAILFNREEFIETTTIATDVRNVLSNQSEVEKDDVINTGSKEEQNTKKEEQKKILIIEKERKDGKQKEQKMNETQEEKKEKKEKKDMKIVAATQAVFDRLKSIKIFLDNTSIKSLLEGNIEGTGTGTGTGLETSSTSNSPSQLSLPLSLPLSPVSRNKRQQSDQLINVNLVEKSKGEGEKDVVEKGEGDYSSGSESEDDALEVQSNYLYFFE